MNNPVRILVVDDEPQMRRLLQITFESNDYKVLLAATGREGMVMAATERPDIVILDLGLPDVSGQMVLKELRQWYTKPVIILSVQNNEEDIVLALDNGANDYLTKPFRTGELLARIRTALRSASELTEADIFQFRNFSLDFRTRQVLKDKEIVKLTVTEYALLGQLVRNAGKVLTHQFLLREVWGPGYINQSQYLRVFIAQLRKKLEDDPNRPSMIITESGIGYRFETKE